METVVLIVGAGPAGLAASACLNHLNIPNVIVEREDCYASLWSRRTYDRLQLHIAKQYCQLPYLPYPSDTPLFIPKTGFISYLDYYVSHFRLNPRYNCSVESASYDKDAKKWRVTIKNTKLNFTAVYFAEFLVAATGENSEGMIPEIRGLESFEGEYMHSSKYKNGKNFNGKDVLVVGVGNSGMEIAFDLSSAGATTSIVARGPVHVVTKEMVLLGMFLLRFLPCKLVDFMTVILSWIKFGDISKYGLQRPKQGPFYLKATAGRSPTIDVGAAEKIRKGKIEVLPPIAVIEGKEITFENGKSNQYDAIIFATGYGSTVGNWLQDDYDLFDENGMPMHPFPNHWKGKDGLYCAGFSQMGLMGISNDAHNIATDISTVLAQAPQNIP